MLISKNRRGIDDEFKRAFPEVNSYEIYCYTYNIWIGGRRWNFNDQKLYESYGHNRDDEVKDQAVIDKCRRVLTICRLKGYL